MSENDATDDTFGRELRIRECRAGVQIRAMRVLDSGDPPDLVALEYELDIAGIYWTLSYHSPKGKVHP